MRNKSRIFNKAISPIVVSNRINSEKDNKKVKNLFPYFLNPRLPKKKFAFTLAEVLITLGIIGVVASITIPTLSQKLYEKRTVTQLRAVQSILSQSVKAAEAEDGEVEGWELKLDGSESDAQIIGEKLLKHIKVAHDCGTEPDEKSICVPYLKYNTLNGGTVWGNYSALPNYYKVKLNNGASLWWRSGNHSIAAEKRAEMYIDFFVDVNGSALPNMVGKDVFDFYYEKGSLRVAGTPHYLNSGTCSLTSTGWGCAYYVLTNGKLLK